MTKEEARQAVVEYWLRKADSALASVQSELAVKRLDFAVNRIYYASFYAASAVLLKSGKKFVKHSGLRGAVHQDLVKPGMLDAKWGRIYDQIFESRQSGDYLELYEFEAVQVIEMLTQAEGFIKEMKRLLVS